MVFVLTICSLTFFTWVAHLNRTLHGKFSGRRFVIPSRVYSQPLELYTGSTITRKRLLFELAGAGYRQRVKLEKPGDFRSDLNRILVWRRAFSFWDADEEATWLQVVWKDDVISISDKLGRPIDRTIRLEPIDIGGIYPRIIEDRILVRLDEIPEKLIAGLLAVEDRAFFEHFGVRPASIGRAIWINLKAGRVVQGGSTLTQQLVKNLFLSSEKQLERKFREALMAVLLELQFEKKDILETYFNQVYFGQNGSRAIHGFGLAANRFFGKDINDLDIGEMATLVGMLKGPNYYDPRRWPERAEARRNVVLKIWFAQGLITRKEQESHSWRGLNVRPKAKLSLAKYPAFIDLVNMELRKSYDPNDLTGSGFRIFTSLDPFLQEKAKRELSRQINRYRSRKLSGSIVTLDASDGSILTLVGGRLGEKFYDGFNHALSVKRPIGSLIKPFVYITALRGDWHLASTVDDTNIDVEMANGEVWSPQNFDKKSHGKVMLIDAMARSYNQATVRIGMEVGVDNVATAAKIFGMRLPKNIFPSFLLGSAELSPLEVASLYQPFASGGFRMPLNSIRAVTDSHGEILKSYPAKVQSVLSPEVQYLSSILLRRVVSRGTGRSLSQISGMAKIGGKTGTSSGERDAWFVGVGSKKLSVVWLGNADNQPIGLTGASGSLPVFQKFAEGVDYGDIVGNAPDGIVFRPVNKKGKVFVQGCDGEELPFRVEQLSAVVEECSGLEKAIGWWRRLFGD